MDKWKVTPLYSTYIVPLKGGMPVRIWSAPFILRGVCMKTYKIQKYGAFGKFKKDIGSNNHFLITALVGLDKIDESDIGKVEPAPWNPQDVKASVTRSREFVIKAGLAWVITCLDVFLKDFFTSFFDSKDEFYQLPNSSVVICYEKASVSPVTKKEENKKSYNEVYKSVYFKFTVISHLLESHKEQLKDWRIKADYRKGKEGTPAYFPELELVSALIDLAIQWRNVLVHEGVDNSLANNTYRVLSKYKDQLNENQYGTLNVDEMKQHFKDNKVMTFKEVAVLIRNIVDFGYILNAYWTNAVDKKKYITEMLKRILLESKDEMVAVEGYGRGDYKKQYYDELYTLEPERRKSNICMRLMQYNVFLERIEDERISIEEATIDSYMEKIFS